MIHTKPSASTENLILLRKPNSFDPDGEKGARKWTGAGPAFPAHLTPEGGLPLSLPILERQGGIF